ncbi:MAG: KEOPS complex subunit Pcc1 [Thermoplasmata archaeon]
MRRACASAAEAERLRAAVAADNPSFVRVEVEGSTLVIRVTAASAESARATLEDLLACLSAAERAMGSSG